MGNTNRLKKLKKALRIGEIIFCLLLVTTFTILMMIKDDLINIPYDNKVFLLYVLFTFSMFAGAVCSSLQDVIQKIIVENISDDKCLDFIDLDLMGENKKQEIAKDNESINVTKDTESTND